MSKSKRQKTIPSCTRTHLYSKYSLWRTNCSLISMYHYSIFRLVWSRCHGVTERSISVVATILVKSDTMVSGPDRTEDRGKSENWKKWNNLGCNEMWKFKRRKTNPSSTRKHWFVQYKYPFRRTNLFWVFFNNRFLMERGMASTLKMEYQVFLCIFQKHSAIATLGLKEIKKILWEGR